MRYSIILSLLPTSSTTWASEGKYVNDGVGEALIFRFTPSLSYCKPRHIGLVVDKVLWFVKVYLSLL